MLQPEDLHIKQIAISLTMIKIYGHTILAEARCYSNFNKIVDHIDADYQNGTYSILDENTLSVNQGPILNIEDNYEL